MSRALPIGCLIFLYLLDATRCSTAAEPAAAGPSDPFAYCAAMGNIDMPAGGATPIPAALTPYLASALGLPARSTIAAEGYYWRCMSGAVYVCAVGANIPCDARADRAKRNTGAEHYCRENPDASFVPAYATGHASLYAWSCSAGKPVAGKPMSKLDHRGYRIDFWHRVSR
jgi:hypothetical protein